MFTASIHSPDLWHPFLSHGVFRNSIAWISEHASTAAEGIYEMGEPGWIVNVHGYTTQLEEKCVWENHTRTIDLQYLIEGREGIRVLPVEQLGQPTLYKEESDTQKFASPIQPGHLVILRPGDMVTFLPGEAHCPKIAIGEPAALRKLVVKIPTRLLAN